MHNNDIVWGINAQNHDASICVVKDTEILFASHAERFSRKKNDHDICDEIITAALMYGMPKNIFWHENIYKKTLRRFLSGRWSKLSYQPNKSIKINAPIHNGDHHLSHACGAFYTSAFTDATIIVLDSIGEFITTSVWSADGSNMACKYKLYYPNSLGLFYSAFTHRVGLKPNEEEYIFMGAAAYGQPKYYKQLQQDFFTAFDPPYVKFKHNLQKGCMWWKPGLHGNNAMVDIACSVQKIYEQYLLGISIWAKKNTKSNNLILTGGCALNCVANYKLLQTHVWDNIWIPPNPGDAGNSLGAILNKTRKHVNWRGPYLGHDIKGEYPQKQILLELEKGNIVGVANGRAEFGPRALGNRSLLADPRIHNIKEKLNNVKKRQHFRPFAPVVLEEHVDRFFDTQGLTHIPYMQFAVPCKTPSLYPGIVHIDNTSRIQTVNKTNHPALYSLLLQWYNKTGCPMLINTSLNIKGEPLVNTVEDSKAFQQKYEISVY